MIGAAPGKFHPRRCMLAIVNPDYGVPHAAHRLLAVCIHVGI